MGCCSAIALLPACPGLEMHLSDVSLLWQVGAYLEERVNVGVNFILSAEIDHANKNSRFGFGMAVGE